VNLAGFSISRPVACTIISVTLFVLGLYSLVRMPVSLYPQISFPFVSIQITYPGATADQVEARLLKPLEGQMVGLKGIKKVVTLARRNVGIVILGFNMSVTTKEVMEEIRQKISKVRSSFPDSAKEPIIQNVDIEDAPILIYAISSPLNPKQTYDKLEDALMPSLRSLDGVTSAGILGRGDNQIRVHLNPEPLYKNRISPLDIYESLKSALSALPWGTIQETDKEFSVSKKPLDKVENLNQLPISLKDGRFFSLNELAQIEESKDPNATRILVDGKPGLALFIKKRPESNTLKTIEIVKSKIAKYDIKPFSLFPIVDQSTVINENTHEVWIALFIGGLFAILVILFFLMDWRSAIISATALPVSVAGTFIFMSYLGFSINMMSLLALSLAIGLLIDDAVVVRESIFKEIEQGKSAKQAALDGTSKVFTAVLSTTLAIIAVFIPIGMMEGMIGQFFKEFGFTICVAILLSLWVAFTLDPMLSAYWSHNPTHQNENSWKRWKSFLQSIDTFVLKCSKLAFHSPILVLLSAFGLFGLSIFLTLQKGSNFLAVEDRGQFSLSVHLPAGSTLDATQSYMEKLLLKVKDLPGLVNSYTQIGESQNNNFASSRLLFKPKNQRSLGILDLQRQASLLIKDLKEDYPETKVLVMDPATIEGVGSGDPPVTLNLYGEDLEKLAIFAKEFEKDLSEIPGISATRIQSQLWNKTYLGSWKENDRLFFQVSPNTLELASLLTFGDLELGTMGEKNLSVFLQTTSPSLSLMDKTYIPTIRGYQNLSRFMNITEKNELFGIDRQKRQRKIVVGATLDHIRTYGNVIKDVDHLLKEKVKEPFSYEIGGDKEFFDDMLTNFMIAIIFSFFFIFIVLAIQLENIIQPIMIIVTLPLAIIGGFFSLLAFQMPLALGSLIGLVLLIGLAAKNGILLVDSISKKTEMTVIEAVVTSVKERSRPIIMTSVAMILGMLPTAILRGSGSEFRAPMAICIIGGVLSSTFFSFLVIPSLFGLTQRFKKA
jgi:HAE1 family hydrophobic/amphiphilic exporter-1